MLDKEEDELRSKISEVISRKGTKFGDQKDLGDDILREQICDINEVTVQMLGKEKLAAWILFNKPLVDHRPFNFFRHRYLIELYKCEDVTKVVQKAAQMGATIWIFFDCIHTLVKNMPYKAGYFLPNKEALLDMSRDRLTPLFKENPSLVEYAGLHGEDLDKFFMPDSKKSESMLLKQIGASTLYMRYMGGVMTKDSTPMDGLYFDELRLMNSDDVAQTDERISHSDHKHRRYISTAGYPGQDINAKFLGGTQNIWHSKCGCGPDPENWVVLHENFPDCIVIRDNDVFYRCPKCNYRINDPQNGAYVPANPDGDYESFHFSQLISDYISPKEIWNIYQNLTSVAEFYRSKLGIPYIDKDAKPLTEDIIMECESKLEGIVWGPLNDVEKRDYQVGMGVDQRSGQNHVIIAAKHNATGRYRILHAEVIDKASTRYKSRPEFSVFDRCIDLMTEYDVNYCLTDSLPNANDAMRFGRKFPGKVYLAFYTRTETSDMVRWLSDRPISTKKRILEKPQVRKSGEAIKFKWKALIHRYFAIEFALMQFVNHNVRFPDVRGLIQDVRNKKGKQEPTYIFRELVVKHVASMVRLYNKTESSSKKNKDSGSDEILKVGWGYTGSDPHFTHAWTYCTLALERLKSKFRFFFVATEEEG